MKCNKINRKIVLIALVIFSVCQGISAIILERMISTNLKATALERINSITDAKQQQFSKLTTATNADLSIIQKHDAIETLFISLDLGDDYGAETAQEGLANFFKGIYGIKPQYELIQLSDRQQALIQLNSGESTKEFNNFDYATALQNFEEKQDAKQGRNIIHQIKQEAGSITLISAIPLITTEGLQGILWLQQPLDSVLDKLFADVESHKMACIIKGKNGPIKASSSVTEKIQTDLNNGELQGWVTAARQLKDLGWQINFAMPAKEVFKFNRQVIKQFIWSFIASIGLAVVVLGLIITRQIVTPIVTVIQSQNQTTGDVGRACENLTTESHKLADSVSSTASTLEEVAATVEEISATSRQNAASATEVKQKMESDLNIYKESAESMHSLSESMEKINNNSSEIKGIVTLIDQIAFQTNLLALNAAVEAARAGEAGAGFAVVADEVRNLAQRSSKAAQDTSELVFQMSDDITAGKGVSDGIVSTFSTLNDSFVNLMSSVDNIANASKEQALGTEQIATAISSLDQTSQDNSHTASMLTELVDDLDQQVTVMKESADTLTNLACSSQGAANKASDHNSTMDSEAARKLQLESAS